MIKKTEEAGLKKIEEQRFEFLLYINKHIICQRYFSVNNFNEESLRSCELKGLMEALVGTNGYPFGNMGLITNHLKNKSVDYLYKFYNPHSPKSDTYKNNYEKEDFFDFEIRVDKNVVASSRFSGNIFPQQVRYQVDIKEIIPQIISEIKDTLSKKKYTRKYNNFSL
jgi:hypothetical protein